MSSFSSSSSKLVTILLFLCLALVFISAHGEIVDCGDECIPTTTETSSSSLTNTEIRSRKLLLHNNAEEVFKSYAPVLLDQHQHQHQQQGGNVNVDWSSLWQVPAGPDPSGNGDPIHGSSLWQVPAGPDPSGNGDPIHRSSLRMVPSGPDRRNNRGGGGPIHWSSDSSLRMVPSGPDRRNNRGGGGPIHQSPDLSVSLRVVPSGPDPLHHSGSGPNDNL